jgi:methanogenic corrinoid protein MtbC1
MERHIAGESIRKLAAEIPMAESSLRALISAQSAQIKTVANQMVNAERAFQKLPLSAQITTKTIAARLMRMMDNMASGAELASGSYMRLMMAHNAMAAKVDEAEPMTAKGSAEALVAMAAIGKIANQAAEIPIRFVAAMKDGIAGEEDEEGGTVIRVVGGLPD